MCEGILRAGGYKTGLFTSPYLHSFRESIRLLGELITEEQLIDLINEHGHCFEATDGLTAFELTTVLALTAFASTEVEVAVLEVGLGGRLDATNVVDPVISVILPISYDHTHILGDSLTQITREKAGIIRSGGVVVSAPQVDEVAVTLEQECEKRQAQLIWVNQILQWKSEESSLGGQTFSISGESYFLPLIGVYQMLNAVTAITVVNQLCRRTGVWVSTEAVKSGLAAVSWPGRMEILNRRPHLVLDSAMNEDSAEKLAKTLQQYFKDRRVTLIFGASSDHAIDDMLRVLLPVSTKIIVTAASHYRAESTEKLARAAAELGYEAAIAPDAVSSLTLALSEAEGEEVICVTGSLFLVAEIREAWLRRQDLLLPPIDPQRR